MHRIYGPRCTDFSNVSVGPGGRKRLRYPRLARTAQALAFDLHAGNSSVVLNQNRLRDAPIYGQISLHLFVIISVVKFFFFGKSFFRRTFLSFEENQLYHIFSRK